MKKTVTINLAGIVYLIDDDAYDKLKRYLNTLEKNFKNEKDSADIIMDIEARISELFSEKLGNKRQVVTMSDIEFIIQTLGDPEQIADEESNFKEDTNASAKRHRYRRIYRDPENRIVGGVCSGLASYWHIDPSIMRIAFIVLVIMGGSGLIIYLVLWIVIPEAQTTAQKLEMRGEPVTVENIKDFVKDEFENVKKNFKSKRKSNEN